MNNTILFGMLFAFMMLAGVVAKAFGVVTNWIDLPVNFVGQNANWFQQLIGALSAVENAIGWMLQLMTFQADGVPFFVIVVYDALIGFTAIRILRGGM